MENLWPSSRSCQRRNLRSRHLTGLSDFDHDTGPDFRTSIATSDRTLIAAKFSRRNSPKRRNSRRKSLPARANEHSSNRALEQTSTRAEEQNPIATRFEETLPRRHRTLEGKERHTSNLRSQPHKVSITARSRTSEVKLALHTWGAILRS